ncbi:high frequency lysogenization protein HflD [Teredinibacter turnerae]|uniref:high frequency lysogenization protein HflD n=1 Tax=Teredinibacter turnerae TaxID=2426 RepID=UPI000366E36C|nr:high frequency lysogenization protein HflD [Teredinibacter turnerae]
MQKSWRNIAIALAGMTQCARQVEELAKTGYLKTEVFETAVKSLINTDPSSADDVFGGLEAVQPGLSTLKDILEDHRSPGNADILRYVLGAVVLQKRLARRKDVLYIIGNRLEKVSQQVEHFGCSHDNVVSNIADIYTDTISKFPYRIQVTGEFNYLQQERVAAQIRSLLFAAIRAATLWRQAGGTRWHMLFYRSKMLAATEQLLQRA